MLELGDDTIGISETIRERYDKWGNLRKFQ